MLIEIQQLARDVVVVNAATVLEQTALVQDWEVRESAAASAAAADIIVLQAPALLYALQQQQPEHSETLDAAEWQDQLDMTTSAYGKLVMSLAIAGLCTAVSC